MLNDTTVNKLHEMKLSIMAQAFREQLRGANLSEMAFEERFGLLVDAEWAARKNNRLSRLIKNADFAFSDACIENVEYHDDRKLDKAQITRLATCNYIQEAHNIIYPRRNWQRENLSVQCLRHGCQPELLHGQICACSGFAW